MQLLIANLKCARRGNDMEKIKITVDTAIQREPIGDLYGIFFEDINHAADGGLYAEMIQNRGFEFSPIDNKDYRPLTAWEKVEEDGKADWLITTKDSVSKENPHHLVINITKEGNRVGVRNHGYQDGMFFETSETYRFSCYAKATPSEQGKTIQVLLTNPAGDVIAEADFEADGEWRKYEILLSAMMTENFGELEILVKGRGRLELDFVSLMPVHTFKNRKNGMRNDLAMMLKNLTPAFMRFPGGCLIHDGEIDSECRNSMYRWKKTIGDPIHRPARRNNWHYNQSLGIGYYEFFLFCEDIGSEPLPVLPAGYNPHSGQAVPVEDMGPWIQDALDLIEFANGDMESKWGNIRTALGHPEPFRLKYIAIGNEEVGDAFWERYALFHKKIKEKYSDIKIINSAGPFCAGEAYENGWRSAKENQSDLIDEHYYQAPEWFIGNHHRYDEHRGHTKVFLGEYASCGNKWRNALAEASYMIGLEKNVHSVGLACYAPLLCNSSYVDWNPNLIWFNNRAVYGTPNYYVQKLFMNHKGDYRLACQGEVIVKHISLETNQNRFHGGIYLSGYHGKARFTDIVVKNLDTGEMRKAQNVFAGETEKYEVGYFEWEHFEVKWKAVQPKTGWGFNCFLGYRDDKNHHSVNFGDWENKDLFITETKNGVKSLLNQRSFHVVPGKIYDFHITVKGSEIQVTVDNVILMEYKCMPLTMESLYYTASKERNGDVIVKLVNVTEEDKEVEIILDDPSFRMKSLEGDIFFMEGFQDDDYNSFDEPEKVVPSHEKALLVNGTVTLCMPGKALRIYRFKEQSAQHV